MKLSILSFPFFPLFCFWWGGGGGLAKSHAGFLCLSVPTCLPSMCCLPYLVIWFSDREKYQLIVRLLNLKSASMATSRVSV